MLTTLQDLTAPQNWTLLSILGAAFVAVIGLLVWLVKWLCSRFAASLDKNTEVVGESTQVLRSLKDSHDVLRESVSELPEQTANEFQRRKLG